MSGHDLLLLTSVQGYCSCGEWGMASTGGLSRLRELHADHQNKSFRPERGAE